LPLAAASNDDLNELALQTRLKAGATIEDESEMTR
jgi:hypothetical protein